MTGVSGEATSRETQPGAIESFPPSLATLSATIAPLVTVPFAVPMLAAGLPATGTSSQRVPGITVGGAPAPAAGAAASGCAGITIACCHSAIAPGIVQPP